jgi:hypothetical protein
LGDSAIASTLLLLGHWARRRRVRPDGGTDPFALTAARRTFPSQIPGRFRHKE